jgi:hypothetical protein
MQPLSARANKTVIADDHVAPSEAPGSLNAEAAETVAELVGRIRSARAAERPVVLAFGAHSIKNGLAPVMQQLLADGWVTHLATNGAGIIHDWEFAFQGESSEDVRAMVDQGRFGNWQETGFNINLALNIGAFEGRGYGESVGAMIHHQQLYVPHADVLVETARAALADAPERAAAAADLLAVVREFDLAPGVLEIPHPYQQYSLQATAFALGVPFTGHPMFGHDIIYNHPMNRGGALGRAAQRDFLTYAEAISRIDGGVYLSVGSAVMSPMIFEKSFSMAQNLAVQRGEHIDDHYILVADLAESRWDWRQGEPPPENPDYYLRYNKTFSRMGGEMRYLSIDNRDLLLTLCHELGS